MKRFLSVLASLSIVGSTAVTVISCSSQQNNTQNIFNKVNHQLITVRQEPSKLTVASYRSAIDEALIKKTGLSAKEVDKITFLNNNQDVATGFVPNRIGFNVNGEAQHTGYFNLGFIQKFSQSLKRMRMILPSGTNGDLSSPDSEGIHAIQKAIMINNPLVTAAEASNFELIPTLVPQTVTVSTDLNALSFTTIRMKYLGQFEYDFQVMIPQNGVFRSQVIARSFANVSVTLPSWVNNSTTNDLTKQIIIDKLVETNPEINFTDTALFNLSNTTLQPETVSPSNDVNITIQENSSQSPVNKAIQVILKPKTSDTAEAIINAIKNTNLQLNLLYSRNLDNRNTLLALRNELYELNKDNNLKKSDLDAIYFRLPSATSAGSNRLINGTNTVELLLVLSGSAVSVPTAKKAVTIKYQSKSQSENGLATILPQLMEVAGTINLPESTSTDINTIKPEIVKNLTMQLDLDPFQLLTKDLPLYLQSPNPGSVTKGVETEVTFQIGKTPSATNPTGNLDILIATSDQETADNIINSITVTDIFLPSWGVGGNTSIANNPELQLNLKTAIYNANKASDSSLSVSQLQYIFFRSGTPPVQLAQGQSITENIYADFNGAESREVTLTIRWRTIPEDLALVKGALENTNLEITWPSSVLLPTTADKNIRSLVWAELRTLFPRLNEPYRDISAKMQSYKSYFYHGKIEQKTITENFTEFRITLDIGRQTEAIPINLKVILS